MEDRAHPLRVSAGEIVVDGHDVDAPSGHRIEGRRKGREERLALAGLHLGDLPLVQDDAAEQLDVVLAHPERPAHRLAAHRKDLGQDAVEGCLNPIVLALATRLDEIPAALEVGVVTLVVRRLVGNGGLGHLRADLGEPGPDLLVGEGLDLGLEFVGGVDEWLDPLQFSVVRVDEARQKSQHGRCSLAEVPPIRA